MRLKKLFFIFLLAFAVVLISAGCENAENPENSESASSEEEIEYTEDYYDRLFLGEVVTEEEKRENIFAALVDININTEFIKEFQKVEDETETEKYSFVYRENNFTVTMNADSEVSSVRIGEDGADIYLEGYESYNVDDYIVTDSMIKGLEHMNINVVEIAFNYPKIYEFADDWTYVHEEPFRYVSGSVLIGEAKEKHFLDIVYYYDKPENTLQWYSVYADGNEITFDRPFSEPEIKERQPLSGD